MLCRPDRRADTTCRADVAKIAKQSIGQVDRSMRNATQCKTCGVARRRPIESRTQAALIVDRWTVSLLPVPQCQRRITERAGHADQITDQIGRASCRERVCQYV